MVNEIDILLGGDMNPQQTETEAMAAVLRGQLNEGNALGMSTIGGVSQFGNQQSKAARQGAKQAGRLKQSLEKEARAQKEIEAKEARAFKQWEKKQSRQQQDKMDFEQFKNNMLNETKDASPKGIKPSASATKDYIQTKRVMSGLTDAIGMVEGFNAKEADQMDSPIIDAVTDTLVPATAERYLQDQFIYNEPKVKEFRSAIAGVEAEIRKILSGTQVTGYELKDIQKWSPNAAGIGLDTRKQRMKKILSDWGKFKTAQEEMYNFGDAESGSLEQPAQDVTVTQEAENDMTVTMAELQAMGATPEEAAAAGYKVVR